MSSPDRKDYPAGWLGDADGHTPEMLQLKGRDYLTVASRIVWFTRDQRALIAAGLATTTYEIRTEIVEIDRTQAFAHFKTYIRDVLGNEATMYGSETAKDFGDFIEKASTKSAGRALLMLGYGTASAQELAEGERVVDAPQEPRRRTPERIAAPTDDGGPFGHADEEEQRAKAKAQAPAFGMKVSDLRERAAQLGIVGEAWGTLFHRCKGDANAIYLALNGIEQDQAKAATR